MDLNIPTEPVQDPEEEVNIRSDFIDYPIIPCLVTFARTQLGNPPDMTNNSGVTLRIRVNEQRPSTFHKTQPELANQNRKENTDRGNPSLEVNGIQMTSTLQQAPTYELQLLSPDRVQVHYPIVRLSRMDQHLIPTGTLGSPSDRNERQSSATNIVIRTRHFRIQISAVPEPLTHNVGTAVGSTVVESNAGVDTAVGNTAGGSNAREVTSVGNAAENSDAGMGTTVDNTAGNSDAGVGTAVGTTAENSDAGVGTAVGNTVGNTNARVAATTVTVSSNLSSAEHDELCSTVPIVAHPRPTPRSSTDNYSTNSQINPDSNLCLMQSSCPQHSSKNPNSSQPKKHPSTFLQRPSQRSSTSAPVHTSGDNNAYLPSSSSGSFHGLQVPLEIDSDYGEPAPQKPGSSRKRKLSESDEPMGPQREPEVAQNILEDLHHIDQMWTSIEELNVLFRQAGPNNPLLHPLEKIYRRVTNRKRKLLILQQRQLAQEGSCNKAELNDEDFDMNDNDE